MLNINAKQLASMQNKEDVKLAEWIIEDLKQAHPEDLAKYPNDLHVLMAYNGIQRATKYHFELKASYALFVQIMFMMAPNFDQYPPIKFILEDGTLDHDKKMSHVSKEMTDENWAAVKKRHNNDAWGLDKS